MDALVLDVSYQPIGIRPWETVIVWVLERVAEVVEEDPTRLINTVNWSIKMPSVVRLLKPVKRTKAVKFSRHGIYSRDKGKCQYCGAKVRKSEMQYEHVIPRSQGGTTCWTNIVVACLTCNQKKGGRTPVQAGMRLLSVPVRPKSLPDAGHGICFNPSMPAAWRNYLRDHAYWNTPLDED
jgi:5-methylcytosine-specific restriction endonuclease McrA